jgi:type I restriction enzyme S subunit
MKSKLPESWKKIKLEDVIDVQIDNRGRNPSNYLKYSEYPVIDNYLIKNERYPNMTNVNRYIDEDTFNNFLRGYVNKDDVIITLVGNGIANVSMVPHSKAVIIQNTLGLRCINSMYNIFLYYTLLYNQKLIKNFDRGSSQPSIRKTDLFKHKILMPPLPEQKAIAETLSVLDDKIELNKKINENLEKQAQALFKHWFVDFQFPDENGNPYKSSGGEMIESELGLIPKGWEVLKLGSKLKVELGGTPARKNSNYWNGDINWINSGELNSYRIISETEKITKLGLEKSSTKLWPKNTTVIAITGATLGKTSLLLIDTCANQSVVGIKESEEIPHTYVYPYIFSRVPELVGHQTGGAQQHINKGNIEELDLILPKLEVLKRYNDVIKQHYRYIEIYEFQNIKISQLRDTLLPKLISGEIRITLD